MKTNETKTIYHYTNWNAFEGIVGKKILRLSNINYSNDASEILFGLYQLGFVEAMQIFVMLDNIGLHNKEAIIRALNKFISKNPLFALCFSKNRDDVAQWERYAQNSCGVCIGFNENKIRKILEFEQFNKDKKYLRAVIYSFSDKTKEQLDNMSAKLQFLKIKEISDANDEFESVKSEIVKILEYISYISYYMKHPSFKIEREVRIALNHKDIKNIKCNVLSSIKYETDKDRIREFVELDLEALCKDKPFVYEDLIDEIIIGPKSIMDEGLVKRYLTSNGLDGLCKKVKKSTSTIR